MKVVIHYAVVPLLTAAMVTTLAMSATTIYLHRALSHRALTLRRPAALLFRTIIWLTSGIVPREWVAVHRKHHAYTDTEGDPHSPVLLGWKTVQMKNVALYRATLREPGIVEKYARDLPPGALDRILFDRSLIGLAIGISLLVIALGPTAGLIAAFIHANAYLAGNAAVNAMGHHFGRRPYANRATNLQWLAWFTMGEGLHNNHHAAPSSPRLSHRRREIDPGWWVIRVLSAMRLASLRFADIRLTPAARTRR